MFKSRNVPSHGKDYIRLKLASSCSEVWPRPCCNALTLCMFGFMPLSFHARAASSLLNLRVFDNVPNYRLLVTAAGFESKSLQPK